MFILDTNVLSELMDPTGDADVVIWADRTGRQALFTTAVNQAEILYGLAIMPQGRKRMDRIMWADAMFAEDFRGRILPFDDRAAGHYADIAATETPGTADRTSRCANSRHRAVTRHDRSNAQREGL